MSYEIPQQLEYKEKIMFGLTFKQLGYLGLFAPMILILFFKSSLHMAIKIPIMALIAGFAIGFIFLDLDKHLRNWYSWYMTKNITLTHKLESFSQVKEIENDLIITQDDRKLAVIKITPINFSIKPEESKKAISIGFQKFLNSLDFPIQIIMSTEKLNLKEYFRTLERKIKGSKKFKILFKGYKNYLELITKENDVMNRVFYLIIPEKTDIKIQLHICQAKLANIGLKSIRLKEIELIALLKNFFIAQPKKREAKKNVEEKA